LRAYFFSFKFATGRMLPHVCRALV
jgi:hypothetical protein